MMKASLKPDWSLNIVTKRSDFLWLVQTTLIAYSVDAKLNPSKIPALRAGEGEGYNTEAIYSIAKSALMAAEKLPDNLSAIDAAEDFLNDQLDGPAVGDGYTPTRFWVED